MQLVALRAQVDALLALEQMECAQQAEPLNQAETCPKCGATGETQVNTSTLDGTKRRQCLVCGVERVL